VTLSNKLKIPNVYESFMTEWGGGAGAYPEFRGFWDFFLKKTLAN